MKEVKIEDMIPNKNYLAVITVAKETYFHTVSFIENDGFCEYKAPVYCGHCGVDVGDVWDDAKFMLEDHDLKIYEV